MRLGYLILVLSLLIVTLFSGCIGQEKECEADADCLAKDCFTVQCKDNKCVYSPIADCCGNEICEPDETYENCFADCPNCDDNNECTIDSYDYHEQKCVNSPILDVVCCGNGLCELGETYETCTRDCPNCDDDNKLTTDSFNYNTQECENIVTHYFIDDFEEGIQNWAFSSEEAGSAVVEDGNTVLRLVGVEQANLQREWDNFIFKFRFKRIDGSVHVDFRRSSSHEYGQNRYLVSISEWVNSLGKQMGESWQTLKDADFKLDKNWHTLEVRCYDNIINVYTDDVLIIKYKDTENPLLSGGVRFEAHTGGRPEIQPEFLIDDVEIKVITEEDIIYP